MKPIELRGATTNNLKGVDLRIERGELLALVGPSGAGKSSLAFATLYAEGQRRYIESFSAYARQFLERLPRPPVESLEPIPAAVAVDRKGPVKTSRSTVGTMTEIADYAKDLWARVAVPHCPLTGEAIRPEPPDEVAARLLDEHPGARITVTAPLRLSTAEAFLELRETLIGDGYRRVHFQGAARDLDELRPSDLLPKRKNRADAERAPRSCGSPPEDEPLDVLIDRLVVRSEDRSRLIEAIEAAYRLSEGRVRIHLKDGGIVQFSRDRDCPTCEISYRDPSPAMFSFNSALGACPECRGFGRVIGLDLRRALPDPKKSINQGAIAPFSGKATEWERRLLRRDALAAGIDLDKPIGEFTPDERDFLLHGAPGKRFPRSWGGLFRWFEWLETKAYKMHVRVFLARYRAYDECPRCKGARLRPEPLLYRIHDKNIAEFFAMPVSDAIAFLTSARKELEANKAAQLLFDECLSRLRFLEEVGLSYLSLDRQSRTLSGGETQRVALAGALGATLTNALFVLDEPTAGLHAADSARLVQILDRLARAGNSVLTIEHEQAIVEGADRVVELGPGSGATGGEIVFDGTPEALRRASTLTAQAWSNPLEPKACPRTPKGELILRGASGNNLKNATLRLPLGSLTAITGVSGSGKSSLIFETLHPAIAEALGLATENPPLAFESLEGGEAIRAIEAVDQSPLGRTSRGNVATYLTAWNVLRKRLSETDEARSRGLSSGYFSLNVEGGRCEVCKGQGHETVEMQFLADVSFPCASCGGKRFTEEALEIVYDGLNAAELLDLTVLEASRRFGNDRPLARLLAPAVEIGLGYLRLGQPLQALSGGEAQRLKLVSALSQRAEGTLFLFDEPSVGLHPSEVALLQRAFDRLVSAGGTVVVVEHDLSLALTADHVIDLGPGGGPEGGSIVFEGAPAELLRASGKTAEAARTRASSPPRSTKLPARQREKLSDELIIEGAREHNLKNLSIMIPTDRLVAIAGKSGSGKSTLAFDIVHSEGQRRFLETLSPYARQYLPQLPRPDVDRVVSLPPTVALEQRLSRGSSMSTVGTLTEIAHFIRLLYARVGKIDDGAGDGSLRGVVALAREAEKFYGRRGKAKVYAPIVRGRKGLFKDVLESARREGFKEALIDGKTRSILTLKALERYQEHDISLPIATVKLSEREELIRAIRDAAERADGEVHLRGRKGKLTLRLEPEDDRIVELDPRLFSFNTRQGACPRCDGEGALIAKKKGRRETERRICPACKGTRLSDFARSVSVDGTYLHELLGLDIAQLKERIATMRFEGKALAVAGPVLKEIERRLDFLIAIGLDYLALDRSEDSLSGGESQRVRLAAQLGSGLTGILYVLDEPTIGLHATDTHRLIRAMRGLVKQGNGVIVVEHDSDVLLAADHLIDIGPSGGNRGGEILAEGPPEKLRSEQLGITLPSIDAPFERRLPRPKSEHWIELKGASGHNLQEIDIAIPAERLTLITGVSGSGKSSLIRGTLLPAVKDALGFVTEGALPFRSIALPPTIHRAVEVDQSPIGRTPRSVPATYLGIWDAIRALLAATPDARARGYTASRFSFNVKEGRCPSCEGNGVIVEEMAFLPSVEFECESCKGQRFSPETLEIRFRGLSAGEILNLEIDEAIPVFEALPKIAEPLRRMSALGLGYLRLGQRSSTLSGGEAQRLKLVTELGATQKPGTLYILDEPSTGLHREDVKRLLDLLERFVDRGDTVVVIEHHLDLIASADHIIDLGPAGGTRGGKLLGSGPPEAIAESRASPTARVLKPLL